MGIIEIQTLSYKHISIVTQAYCTIKIAYQIVVLGVKHWSVVSY